MPVPENPYTSDAEFQNTLTMCAGLLRAGEGTTKFDNPVKHFFSCFMQLYTQCSPAQWAEVVHRLDAEMKSKEPWERKDWGY